MESGATWHESLFISVSETIELSVGWIWQPIQCVEETVLLGKVVFQVLCFKYRNAALGIFSHIHIAKNNVSIRTKSLVLKLHLNLQRMYPNITMMSTFMFIVISQHLMDGLS